MNVTVKPQPDVTREKLEIGLAGTTELSRLGLGTLIDIRQAFEIET